MTDWYYHDPIEGRVGPLPAEQLRARYRERRIRRDTLVWHAGLREWSPLEREAETLELSSVTPDASLPPPLPRTAPPAPPRLSAAPHGVSGAQQAPARKGMSGCLIALLAAAALSVPLIGILAAIAIPAYQQYVVRSKVVAALAAATPVKTAIEAHADADPDAACPGNGEAGIGTVRSYAAPTVAGIETGTFDTDLCGIAIMLRGTATLQGKHLWLERASSAPGAQWTCSSDLDAALLPATCRTP